MFHDPHISSPLFNLADDTHSVIELTTETRPQPRHGHSLVVYLERLYMYGGLLGGAIVTDELWEFNVVTNHWTRINLQVIKRDHPESMYFATSGHTAHVIDGVMYVIFGHSAIYGYLNTVQECNLANFVWTVPVTHGAIVKGGYGHSSVYDPRTLLIYIHGGYHSTSVSSYHLSDSLYAYNPKKHTWKILRSSGEFKYLHTAVILNGLMLVFGGNTHNDTTTSHGATCYSIHFLAYDIDCDRWYSLDEPKLAYDVARYGHTAVAYDNQMFVFGGFNGELLRDLLVYKPGNCKNLKSQAACLASRQGVRCAWANGAHCLSLSEAKQRRRHKVIDTYEPPVCERSPIDPKRGCEELPTKTCPSCVANSLRCVWCDGQCSHGYCSSAKKAVTVQGCHDNFTRTSSVCPTLHNCHACRSNDACLWSPSDNKCHLRMKSQSDGEKLSKCPVPCNTHATCENCTSATCMWCSNERRCVESNSYVVSFLYGQCMEWTTMQSKCPATRCSEMRTCHECKMAPSCGWCNDASDTGLGVCMTGGATGPTQQGTGMVSSSNKCPSERWFFTHCPLCQCNGHSVCRPGTDQCEACSPLVTGPQCQYCKDGYWGTATNGGNCTACDCGDQADTCNRLTGTCYCHTRGVFGKHCDMCDDKYYGNPKDGGTCYYELVTDYQFTFNLSKDEDKHYTHINFMNTPGKISFSQFPQIDLINFFITFFSCFLSLLVLALTFWKLKQKYDSYRREQRRKLMLKQRAKRPAGTCVVDATSPYCSLTATDPPDLLVPRRHRPNKPSPVALEPMMNHKAAALSLLIRMPTGDDDYTPPGVSGLCIGTALVTLGSHRKLSVEHAKPTRTKKPSVTSENCV
ncbi:hypothetical protein NP493_601g02014 [Ridgeia piscesae]|uniref:Laminin EGF-like domain-containing protein n=1 Tax=Ridgeia piscesae TaxID=27915 RepID=A0AAD9KV78_RIDPI|nr:hypothetical protein NP493_601g02014 [Ridgeia piscesae]